MACRTVRSLREIELACRTIENGGLSIAAFMWHAGPSECHKFAFGIVIIYAVVNFGSVTFGTVILGGVTFGGVTFGTAISGTAISGTVTFA